MSILVQDEKRPGKHGLPGLVYPRGAAGLPPAGCVVAGQHHPAVQRTTFGGRVVRYRLRQALARCRDSARCNAL
jgi:hypothetical protein